MKLKHFISYLLVMAAIITGCSNKKTSEETKEPLITQQGVQLIKNGKPYHYIGTNMWYASVLGSTGEGGDRERLCRELDYLKNVAVLLKSNTVFEIACYYHNTPVFSAARLF